jgi:hypothetical protein
MNNQNIECCPKFNPEPWDEKIFEWKEKKFISAKVLTLFYIPVNFGSVITKLMKKAEESKVKSNDWMCLSDHTSMWNMNIYVAVDREVEGAKNITMSGKYLSKVYEGDFKDTGTWCKDFEILAKEKKLMIKKMYMWYTTCPKCAKKYGKNYVVIVSEIKKD